MQFSQIFPTQNTSYTWFFYLGILFFITHLALYGFGLNLSYFGLLLIYIGMTKPVLSTWFTRLLWFFILLDMYANYNTIRKKMEDRKLISIVEHDDEDNDE